MSGYAYDPPASANRANAASGVIDGTGIPSRSFPQLIPKGKPMISKSNLRSLAYYLAVGAAVSFAVAHLAPIKN